MNTLLNLVEWQNLLIAALIAVIIIYLTNFYRKVKRYPPGPTPLPFIGNVLTLRGTKRHFALEFIDLRDKYGPVITFWVGNKPIVFIFDFELAKDAFKRNEFAGRPQTHLGKKFSNSEYSDIVMDDFGPRWECLRRVANSAIRKFSVTDKLAYLVSELIDDMIETIKNTEGINLPFNPNDYCYLLFTNIMSESAYGKRYKLNDPEFEKFKQFFHDMPAEAGPKFALIEFLPIMRFYYSSFLKWVNDVCLDFISKITESYAKHYKDYDQNSLRDLCDQLIFAKNQAISESNDSAAFMTDRNLGQVIVDIFMAGTDTTQTTFKWLILLLANYPETQRKLREEIKSVIGDQMPLLEDKDQCDYVNAFITESMRFRTIAPLGLFHNTLENTQIGTSTIPKNTMVFIHQYYIHNDSKYWKNPEQFKPERFLGADGRYTSSRQSAFVPFGTGKRVCIGEKLANNTLFFVLVRLLQSTSDYEIALENGAQSADLEPNYNLPDLMPPKDYKILFKPLNNNTWNF